MPQDPRTGKEYPGSDIPATDIQATFSNASYVLATEDFTRIAFGESIADDIPDKFRVAIVMPTKDARDLANFILKITSSWFSDAPSTGKEDGRRDK